MIAPLADHGLLEAVPFLVPALAVAVFIGAAMIRDRMRGRTR
jgi:hypothetical protein